MEKCFAIFPHYGKHFQDFSTLWKKVFHTVENFPVAASRLGVARRRRRIWLVPGIQPGLAWRAEIDRR
jgi:hypothetical protein